MPNVKQDIDVLFIGNFNERRTNFINNAKKELKKYKINITTGNFYGNEYIIAINRAKINLNIHFTDTLDQELRIFEVMACGGFCLSERVADPQIFKSDCLYQFSTEQIFILILTTQIKLLLQ